MFAYIPKTPIGGTRRVHATLTTFAEPVQIFMPRNIVIYKGRPEPMGPHFQPEKNGDDELVSADLIDQKRCA